MEECVQEHGKPEVVNTDQGAQYTSDVFTGYLLDQEIQISMDGKGRATDNIFIERFWRSLKYEKIYLNVYENGQELLLGIIEYMNYYNQERRHQSLDNCRPIKCKIKNNFRTRQDQDERSAAGTTQTCLD